MQPFETFNAFAVHHNIDALSALVAAGKARLVFEAHVERVTPLGVDARVGKVPRSFPCDAVFVHVGRVASHELLVRVGIASRAQRH